MAVTKGSSFRRPKKDADKIVDAIERQTRHADKWAFIHAGILAEGMAAIALAASTPDDNSEEVRAATETLKASTNELQKSIDANTPDE